MANLANFMDSALASLQKKGNLDYAAYLYNPNSFFENVIHFSWYKEDGKIDLGNSIQVKILNKPISRTFFPISFLINLVYLLHMMRKNSIDLIRCRLPYLGGLLGVSVSMLTKIPTVVSLGGDNRLPQERNRSYYFNSRLLSYGIENFVLRNADAILVPNEFTRKYVERITLKKNKGKIITIPWILKQNVFDRAYKRVDVYKLFNLKRDVPIILNVGFLNRYKFIDRLFPVIDRLIEKDDFQLVFCGDGPLRDTIKARYSAFMGERIFLLGWQQQDIIMSLMENCNVAWILMSGFVLLEAAAAGAPIVTSDKEWHSEFISDGLNGYIADPDKTDELYMKTKNLLQDKALQDKFRENARKKLEEGYNPERLLDKEIEAYKELMSR